MQKSKVSGDLDEVYTGREKRASHPAHQVNYVRMEGLQGVKSLSIGE